MLPLIYFVTIAYTYKLALRVSCHLPKSSVILIELFLPYAEMKVFVALGRRGVFDGTVENMHLHWKYRELVKIIMKARSFEQVKKVALALEAESSGILVSVDKISKGYAILVYRGKDYQRPSTIRPKNLLTKRKALARSIELQRHEVSLRNWDPKWRFLQY